MTIKVGESGKAFNYGTTFDLSSFTTLTLKFTKGATTFTVTNPRVTAPAIDSDPDPDVGVLPANTYMQFVIDGDFMEAGEWTVCGTYIDTAPIINQVFEGTDETFPVEAAC